jgi:hypothetical protein
MSGTNTLSYEETLVLQTAVDTVLKSLDEEYSRQRRNEVAVIILSIANEAGDYDALTLATLALEKLSGEQSRKRA